MTPRHRLAAPVLLLLLGILLLAVFLPVYCMDARHSDFDLSVEEVIQRLQPGDIILTSRISTHVNHHRLIDNIKRIGTHGNIYTHVSIAVRWQEQMYLFDLLSPTHLLPYLRHLNPKVNMLSNKLSVTSLILARDYLSRHKAIFGYRQVRHPMDSERMLATVARMEQTANLKTAPVTRWIIQLFKAKEPIDLRDVSCSEGIAYLLQDIGVKHDQFCKGMAFSPFVEPRSAIFQDQIYRVGTKTST